MSLPGPEPIAGALERAIGRMRAACPPGVDLLVYGETPLVKQLFYQQPPAPHTRLEAMFRRHGSCEGCSEYTAQWDLPDDYIARQGIDVCRAMFAEAAERQIRARYPF